MSAKWRFHHHCTLWAVLHLYHPHARWRWRAYWAGRSFPASKPDQQGEITRCGLWGPVRASACQASDFK